MIADMVQAQYDQLQAIAERFGRQAAETAQMRQRTAQAVDALRSGGWEGKGSAAFFDEMDQIVFPGTNRLESALEESRTVTLRIVEILQAAEEEAASVFNGEYSGGPGGTGPGGIPGGAGPGGGGGTAGPGGIDLSNPLSVLKHLIGTGGGVLDVIDRVSQLNIKKLVDGIDSLDDLGRALKSFKGFASIGDDLLDTLKFSGSSLSRAGTILGIIGAGMEGYDDWQGGEGLGTVIVSETVEFGLDTALHIAAYTNPISGTIMAAYDIAQFAAPAFGIDPESFDVVDDVTDYIGDVVADPGVLVDDVTDAAGAVVEFGGGLISGIGSLF